MKLLISEEQSSGSDQVNSAIQQLNQVSQETASASEEIASNSEELSSQAEMLKELTNYFKINRSSYNVTSKTTHKSTGNEKNTLKKFSMNKNLNGCGNGKTSQPILEFEDKEKYEAF